VPHTPQWLGSLCVSTHAALPCPSLQMLRPDGQLVRHTPSMQKQFFAEEHHIVGQSVQQLPQWLTSLRVSLQIGANGGWALLPQCDCPAGHGAATHFAGSHGL